MDEGEKRRCTKCDAFKDGRAFSYNKKLGRQASWCKTCQNDHSKLYYRKHRERAKAYMRNYYRVNRERVLQRAKTYYHDHREERLRYARRYNARHQEAVADSTPPETV